MHIRTELLVLMDIGVPLKVNHCLTPGTRIISSHKQIIHAQAWAQTK